MARSLFGCARRAPRFSITSWNQRQRVQLGLSKTNNRVEGFHHAFASLVGQQNPTIWAWIEAVKKQISLTETDIVHQQLNRPPSKRQRRYITMEQHLRTIMTQYSNIRITEYLDLCNVAY